MHEGTRACHCEPHKCRYQREFVAVLPATTVTCRIPENWSSSTSVSSLSTITRCCAARSAFGCHGGLGRARGAGRRMRRSMIWHHMMCLLTVVHGNPCPMHESECFSEKLTFHLLPCCSKCDGFPYVRLICACNFLASFSHVFNRHPPSSTSPTSLPVELIAPA